MAGEDRARDGKPRPRAGNTVRLELALIGHLFTIAIKEWGLGLAVNPVLNIRRPSPGAGRNRRLAEAEERRLMALVDDYSIPMMRWIVRTAIETSMRSSEITGLRKGQVELGKRVVRLLETKNTVPRTVPLSKAATELFREALAYFECFGVSIQRVLTDNGKSFHSALFASSCLELGISQKFTRAYRPQTNGKAERFIQSALREWAYGQPYSSSDHRREQLPAWNHFYNWHRPHHGINLKPPVSRLLVPRKNLLTLHS